MNEKQNEMAMLENYAHLEKVILEHNLENDLDRIKWHMFSNNKEVVDAAQQILETFYNLTSANIPKVLEAKEQAHKDYILIGRNLHVFSREQGRKELNLSNSDVSKIFSRVEIGGAKHCTSNNPQNTQLLFD